MSDEIAKLLAERFLNKEYVSDWAIKCLEKGFDSKSLRMLAATNNLDAPSQTDEYFNRALRELGWDKIEIHDYLMQYAKILSREIVEDKTDPIKASREIYQILMDLDYPSELHAWFDFDEMISDYEEFLKTGRKYYFYRPKEELISEIKKASEELIRE
jgi:hypothetical protein